MEAVFREAHNAGAIVAIERAEGLFNGSALRSSPSSLLFSAAESILYHIGQFPGTVVFCVTTPNRNVGMGADVDDGQIWDALRDPMPRRLSSLITASIEFTHPTEGERAELWQRMVPAKVPLNGCIDTKALSQEFPTMVGASIKAAVFKGCTAASMREEKVLLTSDLRKAALELTASSSHSQRMMESLYM